MEDTDWRVDVTSGKPIGDGCLKCYLAITQGCAMKWATGVKIYNDTSDPEHKEVKKAADEATDNLQKIENGEEVTFRPPSAVTTHSTSGRINYFDVGFLTENEIQKLTDNVTCKALAINLVTRTKEDGSGVETGAYVSLKDLPPQMSLGEILGMKKTRVWCQESQDLREDILSTENQLCQDQGVRTMKFAREAEVANRPLALQSHGSGVVNLQTIIAKSKDIIAERLAKEAIKGSAGEESAAPEDAEEIVDDGPFLGRQAAQTVQPKKQSRRKAAGGAPRGRSPSPSGVTNSKPPSSSHGAVKNEKGAKVDAELSKQLRSTDPELFEVVNKLGYFPDCFQNLTVKHMFVGTLGRSLHQDGVVNCYVLCLDACCLIDQLIRFKAFFCI